MLSSSRVILFIHVWPAVNFPRMTFQSCMNSSLCCSLTLIFIFGQMIQKSKIYSRKVNLNWKWFLKFLKVYFIYFGKLQYLFKVSLKFSTLGKLNPNCKSFKIIAIKCRHLIYIYIYIAFNFLEVREMRNNCETLSFTSDVGISVILFYLYYIVPTKKYFTSQIFSSDDEEGNKK